MDAKHTPGPWSAIGKIAGSKEWTIRAHHQTIATVIPQQNDADNATLLAAAPELLSALRIWANHEISYGDPARIPQEAWAILAKIDGDEQWEEPK